MKLSFAIISVAATLLLTEASPVPSPDWIDDWIAGTGTWKGGPYEYDPVIINSQRSAQPAWITGSSPLENGESGTIYDPVIIKSKRSAQPDWVDDWIAGTGPWKGGDYDPVIVSAK